MLQPSDIQNKFVKDWLEYCGNSESPVIFNLWSGISTLSSCLDRDNTLQIGRFNYFANMYIFLVGPAAVRKSSSASLGKKLLKKYTDCKFGPTDTAGKKQGLLSSFYSKYYVPTEEEKMADEFAAQMAATDAKPSEHTEPTKPNQFASAFAKKRIDDERKPRKKREAREEITSRSLFIFADELSTLIGLNQIEMINFLTEIYYCPDQYEYTLSKESRNIDNVYLNLIGCITPTSLAAHLPPQSVGQGFTSRAIMVYEGVARKKVFPAPILDVDLEAKIGRVLCDAENFDGKFAISPDAMRALDTLYNDYTTNINDTRFQHYEQRRLDHLIKLCMVMAIGEGRERIALRDVADAQVILEATEVNMASSLGELGLDKITVSKQHMREMIVASWPLGVSISVLRTNMLRDMQGRDFDAALAAFVEAGLCMLTEKKHEGVNVALAVPVLNDEVRTRHKLGRKANPKKQMAGKSKALMSSLLQ